MGSEGRLVSLEDGGELFIAEHGSGYPVMLLHGGPGLDHHEFRPWLDPLGDMGLRLIYVDERGQGQSPRVDPATLSVRGFAQDIDRLASDAARRPEQRDPGPGPAGGPSGRARRHTASRRAPRTGTSRSGRGSRHGPG